MVFARLEFLTKNVAIEHCYLWFTGKSYEK